jgi:hypothetical protein
MNTITKSANDTAPASDAVAITPNDNTVLPASRALWIAGAGSGNLSVVMASGNTVNFTGITAGLILSISVIRVRSTGTDVTGIVGLY